MDREILFRGKRLDNGEWVEGSYMEHYYSSRFGCVSAIFINDDVLCKTYRIPVDPSTVGQYTGLTDKNGKKIFEGDILDCGDRVVYVCWHEYCGQWDSQFIRYHGELCSNGIAVVEWKFRATVIGSIHDNHELIGGEDDG